MITLFSQRLEESHSPLNAQILAMLVGMYGRADKLKEAKEMLHKFEETCPDAKLVPPIYLRLALLMVTEGHIEGE